MLFTVIKRIYYGRLIELCGGRGWGVVILVMAGIHLC